MTGSSLPAWGAHRPGLPFRLVLSLSRSVPRVPVIKQLAFLFRRLGRALARDPVDVVHWGHRLRLHARGNVSEATFLFMPRRWDRRERALLGRELGPGAVFVDVGSNAGGYLWWLLHLFGRECRILAIEPEPRLHARLLFNLGTNGFDHVRVERVAVGPEAGEGWLRLAAHNMGENVLVAREPGGAHTVRVPVRRLPELVADAELERVDALKIDVEGLEAAILADYFGRAPESVWPRVLLMERNDGPAHRSLMDRLAGLGYSEALSTPLNLALVRTAK